jgi:hypothetical protein
MAAARPQWGRAECPQPVRCRSRSRARCLRPQAEWQHLRWTTDAIEGANHDRGSAPFLGSALPSQARPIIPLCGYSAPVVTCHRSGNAEPSAWRRTTALCNSQTPERPCLDFSAMLAATCVSRDPISIVTAMTMTGCVRCCCSRHVANDRSEESLSRIPRISIL